MSWFEKILISLCAVLVATSCSDDQCEGNQSVVPVAGLYNTVDGKAITIDSLTIYGIGAPGDSILQDNQKITTVKLPFRSTVGETKYVIQYNQKALAALNFRDTITFIYDPIPYFHSNECGAFYKYRLKDIEYTTYLVDLVEAQTEEFINTKDYVGIKIFYRANY